MNNKKESGIKERFRIMNLLMPPILLLNSIENISRAYGAVSVADPIFCGWKTTKLNPDKPLDSVLLKLSNHPVMDMYGPLDEKFLQSIVDCALEYKVQGAIYYAHVGCRQSAALIRLIKDALNDVDVPTLVLDCDIVDKTVSPESEISAKLSQFFELLEERS